ncbi:hypothetical protein EX30DRAFT_340894 [Ascodesmis nigricans]|uniref:Uncharacterized protein n=1 Tax=Ascodesmis nigricans TaxID=341454 RepID=A0A4S2MXF1_9PEZI|nr:hypothetical protein EX30DRAFT_340894 [Ascodesmis nigricans]
MISTPKFFKDVAQATESKQMDISPLLSKALEREMRGLVDAEKYDIPLLSGERKVFSTKQFFVAYIDVVLTFGSSRRGLLMLHDTM